MRLSTIALLSLIFSYLFFAEYLPPLRRVHVPYDLDGYHYALGDYAYQSLLEGHFPEWDSINYCGSSFIGNPQTALFYPPMWPVLIPSHRRAWLPFSHLQGLVLAHVWLSFLLFFIWLRNKRLHPLACALGAGVFAYSGYLLLQLQHLGLVCGYAWFPLGFLGIDQAIESQSWRPLWKVTAASALCFLAGYPPTWFVFAVAMITYAAFSAWSGRAWNAGLKTILAAGLAIGFSLAICMVQILPTLEASALKEYEPRYGGGIHNPEFFVSYFIPNYFDFGIHSSITAHPGGEYLYLGAPAFFGLLCLAIMRRDKRSPNRPLLPLFAVLVVGFVALTNPFNLVFLAVMKSYWLSQICRSWYFLAGITPAIAALTAIGLDRFFASARKPLPAFLAPGAIALLAAWSLRLLWLSRAGGPGFASGWRGAFDPAVTLALFTLAAFAFVSATGRMRAAAAAAILLCVGVDYRAFGAANRTNGIDGDRDKFLSSAPFPGMNDAVYSQLRAHTKFRTAIDSNNPFPTDMKHFGLPTPQGFDPLFPAQYRKLFTISWGTWLIDIDPANKPLLRLLGVRYFISTEGEPHYARLAGDPEFRLLQPSDSYFKVFELANATPPFHWERDEPGQAVQALTLLAARREFLVRSIGGGRFALAEQFFPGWNAEVDGRPAKIDRWSGAFQSIFVPPGDHRVEFRFRSRGLRIGAWISLASLFAALALYRLSNRRPSPARSPPS